MKVKEFVRIHPPPDLPDGAMLTIEELRAYGYRPQACFPTVSKQEAANAERELGFPIPPLLRDIYLQVSNGLAGFSYDIPGLRGGCQTDLGTLVETYKTLVEAAETYGQEWPSGLLPFCYWGCLIFSCVDCNDTTHPISTYEDGEAWPQRYTLRDFFEMWLNGVSILSQEEVA